MTSVANFVAYSLMALAEAGAAYFTAILLLFLSQSLHLSASISPTFERIEFAPGLVMIYPTGPATFPYFCNNPCSTLSLTAIPLTVSSIS